MASKESHISQLSQEIKAYLGNHPDKIEEYENILQKFSSNNENSSILINKLIALFQGNHTIVKKITDGLKTSSPEAAAISSYFKMEKYIQTFFLGNGKNQVSNIKVELYRYMSTIVLLTIQEFLPSSFLNIKLKSIQNLVTTAFIQKINEYMQQIVPIMHSVRVALCDIYLTDRTTSRNKFFMKSSVKASTPMKLIVMAHLQLTDQAQISSFVKCLSLFGFGFLNDELTSKWLTEIDPIIGDFFGFCPDFNDQYKFHPSRIYAQITESELTEDQIQWLFGQQLMTAIMRMPSMHGDNIFISAASSERKSFTKKHLNQIEPSIPDLKSVTFYHSMKIIINHIRKGSPLTGIEESLKAIYGNLAPNLDAIEKNVQFLLKFYERCKSFGGRAKKEFHFLTKQKLETIDINSKEWRVIYWPIIQKSFLTRGIILNGFHSKPLSKKLEMAVYYFVNSFVKHFKSIQESYQLFNQIMQSGGTFYCLESVPLAIIYFMEISKMIQEMMPITKKELESISNLLFNEEPPLKKYSGKFISQIDIPALNFVQCLGKLQNCEIGIVDNLSEIIGAFDNEYYYKIDISKECIHIEASYNLLCHIK
ncbi:hypothetical protein TRFO_36472 [Tritrichomonas foetus]|uniref:Uncharacterized protein n=1 Tax=Tritrichomonas foetus TaxID=1144522 RepID=A0A1J4JIJ5_9EUKA|nr:hypothetical protein TRFO_36472 [Tritrichomonas foetus]|eukprot:OHS97349.1 hypothetical protein TRFO_36472 [Tritrichomonas foetus]